MRPNEVCSRAGRRAPRLQACSGIPRLSTHQRENGHEQARNWSRCVRPHAVRPRQAHAQLATRTWVSGVGDDVNPCTRTAPCKTFAGAISKTATDGEISVLDPGGYGAVFINKSITINGTPGQGYGSIIVPNGNAGIIINIVDPADDAADGAAQLARHQRGGRSASTASGSSTAMSPARRSWSRTPPSMDSRHAAFPMNASMAASWWSPTRRSGTRLASGIQIAAGCNKDRCNAHERKGAQFRDRGGDGRTATPR